MKKTFSAPLFFAACFEYWPMRRLLYRAITERAGRFDGRLLDFGCGIKPYRELFKNVSYYIGVDVVQSGHDVNKKDPDLYFDGIRLPLKSESMDGVVAFEVLEHVPDLKSTLSEITRILRPDGLLLITTPFVWPEHEIPYDFARWTRYGVQLAMEKAGLEVIEVVKLGNAATVIAQMTLIFCVQKFVPHKIPIIRSIAKAFWCISLNLIAILSFLFRPSTNQLYLSTVIIAKKSFSGNCK